MKDINTTLREEFRKWHEESGYDADPDHIADWWLAKFTAYRTFFIETQAKCDDMFTAYIDPYVQKQLAEQKAELVKKLEKEKFLEAAFSPSRLREKQMYNKGIQTTIDSINQEK